MSTLRTADDSIGGRPSRFSQGVAIAASLLAVTVLQSPINVAPIVAVIGAILLAFGVVRGNQRNVNRGIVVQLVAVVVASLEGVSPGQLLGGTMAILIAWDVARYGIVLSTQLGHKPDTTRVELVHAAYSVGVGIAGVALVYGTYQLSINSASVAGFSLLVAGVFVLTAALR